MKKKRKEWKDMTKKEKIAGIIGLSAVLIVIVLGVSGAFDETEEEKAEREARQEQREQDRSEKKADKEEQKKSDEEKVKKETKAESTKKKEPKKELTQDEKIKNKITELVNEESGIKINKIKVVENHSDDSQGGYNVLIHLVFDIQNRPKTAKNAIDAVTDRMGANLAGTKGLENATFFWEVPYIREGDNIIKIGAKQEDGKMYRVEEWYNGHYFE